MENKINKLFWATLATSFIIKSILSIAIPLTGDEAYFVLWGRYLDFGYYDHPPMVGWIMHAMMYLGDCEFLDRLPANLSTIFVGLGIYLLLKPFDRIKALLISTLFLLSPINILNVLISTDTPLIVFSFLSAAFLYKAVNEDKYLYYMLSGVFLGLSFLSKYFAVLLGLSYFIYFLSTKKTRKKTIGFVILYASIIPFVLINIYWNYTHSWANILFNLFNRNKQEEISIVKILLFIICQLYLFTPPILYYLYKQKKEIFSKIKTSKFLIFAFSLFVPLVVFALLSMKKTVGLHWVLSFYPFLYILIYLYLDENALIKSIKFMFFFSLAHLILIGTLLSLPLDIAKNTKNHYEIVMGSRPHLILEHLSKYKEDFILTTPSYTDSAVLSYHSNEYFPVFGGGSHHARQDDIITDFRKFDKKNILVIKQSMPNLEKYEQYFDKVEIKPLVIEKATFLIVLGYAFNYENYKKIVLSEIYSKYYSIPDYIPYASCYFKDKYFQNE